MTSQNIRDNSLPIILVLIPTKRINTWVEMVMNRRNAMQILASRTLPTLALAEIKTKV
jgi:hypothetical protein